MVHEEWDVLHSFAEWRKGKVDDIDSVKEVFTERSFADQVFHVLVCGGDDAGPCQFRTDCPERFKCFLVQDPQDFDLDGLGQVGNFIEEDRPLLGQGKSARFIRSGIGKGASFIAEKFGFDERFRYGPTIDSYERLGAALTQIVDGLGQQFLAGAAFPGNQDRGVHHRNFGQDRENIEHFPVSADDIGEGISSLQFLLEGLDLAQVAEGFDAAVNIVPSVTQNGGRNTDGDFFAFTGDDVDRFIDDGLPTAQCFPKGAFVLTDGGLEDIPAELTDGFLPGNAQNVLSGPIE